MVTRNVEYNEYDGTRLLIELTKKQETQIYRRIKELEKEISEIDHKSCRNLATRVLNTNLRLLHLPEMPLEY
jgi:predicted DNA-binding antitoxin AbrB/MazE fold protein